MNNQPYDNRASKIYYGKKFKPYGDKWVLVGLRDYVSLKSLQEILKDNGVKYTESMKKEQLVNGVFEIYKRTNNSGKADIEKYIYAARYAKDKKRNDPFMKKIDSFFNYLMTNDVYRIKVNPSTASKVISAISVRNIEELDDIKSEMQSAVCKNSEEYKFFNLLFENWFIQDYGITSSDYAKKSLNDKRLVKINAAPNMTLEEFDNEIASIFEKAPSSEVRNDGGDDVESGSNTFDNNPFGDMFDGENENDSNSNSQNSDDANSDENGNENNDGNSEETGNDEKGSTTDTETGESDTDTEGEDESADTGQENGDGDSDSNDVNGNENGNDEGTDGEGIDEDSDGQGNESESKDDGTNTDSESQSNDNEGADSESEGSEDGNNKNSDGVNDNGNESDNDGTEEGDSSDGEGQGNGGENGDDSTDGDNDISNNQNGQSDENGIDNGESGSDSDSGEGESSDDMGEESNSNGKSGNSNGDKQDGDSNDEGNNSKGQGSDSNDEGNAGNDGTTSESNDGNSSNGDNSEQESGNDSGNEKTSGNAGNDSEQGDDSHEGQQSGSNNINNDSSQQGEQSNSEGQQSNSNGQQSGSSSSGSQSQSGEQGEQGEQSGGDSGDSGEQQGQESQSQNEQSGGNSGEQGEQSDNQDNSGEGQGEPQFGQQEPQEPDNSSGTPPMPDVKCPKCGSTRIVQDSEETQYTIDIYMKCEDCGWKQLISRLPKSNNIEDKVKIALIEDGNILQLGAFVGFSPQETLARIDKVKMVVSGSADARGALGTAAYTKDEHMWTRNGDDWILTMSVKASNAIDKYLNSEEKPYLYWKSIYTFQHEFLHVFNDVPPKILHQKWDEAYVPLIHTIFLRHEAGALNPILLTEIAEEFLDRMHMQKTPEGRIRYDAKTFQYFDQFITFYSASPNKFMTFIRRAFQNHMHDDEIEEEIYKAYRIWEM